MKASRTDGTGRGVGNKHNLSKMSVLNGMYESTGFAIYMLHVDCLTIDQGQGLDDTILEGHP